MYVQRNRLRKDVRLYVFYPTFNHANHNHCFKNPDEFLRNIVVIVVLRPSSLILPFVRVSVFS